jgi:hypothetical protein
MLRQPNRLSGSSCSLQRNSCPRLAASASCSLHSTSTLKHHACTLKQRTSSPVSRGNNLTSGRAADAEFSMNLSMEFPGLPCADLPTADKLSVEDICRAMEAAEQAQQQLLITGRFAEAAKQGNTVVGDLFEPTARCSSCTTRPSGPSWSGMHSWQSHLQVRAPYLSVLTAQTCSSMSDRWVAFCPLLLITYESLCWPCLAVGQMNVESHTCA